MAQHPCEPWCVIKCYTAEQESDFELKLEHRLSLDELTTHVQKKCGETYRCYTLRGSGTLRKLRRDCEFQDLVEKCNHKIELYIKKSRTLSISTKQLAPSTPEDVSKELDVHNIVSMTNYYPTPANDTQQQTVKQIPKKGHRRTKSAHATFNQQGDSIYIPEPTEPLSCSFNEQIQQYSFNYKSEGKFVPANRSRSPDSGFQSPESVSYKGDIPRHLTEEFPVNYADDLGDTSLVCTSLSSVSIVSANRASTYEDLGNSHSAEIYLPEGYVLKSMIGSGGFAKVFLCIEVDTGCDIAVKQVFYDTLCEDSNRELKALKNEIQILKTLDHPNIVLYLGSSRKNGSFNILMEYVSGGSMRTFIKNNGPLSVKYAVKCLFHILSGLLYLHQKNIIHRDLKAANILKTTQGTIKIADFGASKQFDTLRSIHGVNTVVGTPYWMSPEVIKAEG